MSHKRDLIWNRRVNSSPNKKRTIFSKDIFARFFCLLFPSCCFQLQMYFSQNKIQFDVPGVWWTKKEIQFFLKVGFTFDDDVLFSIFLFLFLFGSFRSLLGECCMLTTRAEVSKLFGQSCFKFGRKKKKCIFDLKQTSLKTKLRNCNDVLISPVKFICNRHQYGAFVVVLTYTILQT